MSEQPVAMITGAASGIGAATAVCLAERGIRVGIGTFRGDPHDPETTLRDVHDVGGEGKIVEVDVRSTESVDSFADDMMAAWHRIDIAIANAGILRESAFVTAADCNPEVIGLAAAMGAQRAKILDVSAGSAVDALVSDIVAEDGGLDILVCSHGILTQSAAADTSTERWQETIDVDLTGVFLLNRAALRPMLEQRSGRIINIASQLAIKGGVSLAHYAAAKAGVIAMTKSIALETADQGVLVNAIAPGPIETPMVAGIDDQWKRDKLAELPLGRFGTPDEIAPTAVLLASDPGGNLYVGQVLGPNSGDVMP